MLFIAPAIYQPSFNTRRFNNTPIRAGYTFNESVKWAISKIGEGNTLSEFVLELKQAGLKAGIEIEGDRGRES